jgi:hypothetical protein
MPSFWARRHVRERSREPTDRWADEESERVPKGDVVILSRQAKDHHLPDRELSDKTLRILRFPQADNALYPDGLRFLDFACAPRVLRSE